MSQPYIREISSSVASLAGKLRIDVDFVSNAYFVPLGGITPASRGFENTAD